MKRINIIGAGPSGNFLAYLLADKFEVHVYEEHKEIGMPIQCTGILSCKIHDIMKMPEYVINNKISKYKIISKNNSVEFNLKSPDLIVDRHKFDKYLSEIAKKKGAKYHIGERIKEIDMDGIIVGADGPNSIVSKKLGNKNKFFIGVQKIIEKNIDYIEVDLTRGNFSWIVPEGEGRCRYGMFGTKGIRMEDSTQGGLIPIYNTKEIYQKKNLYILGDAATMVKATTGGGMIQGFTAAKILADCLINKKDYKKELRKLRRELWVHLMIRKEMDKLSDNQKDKLLEIASKNKEIIEGISRDNALKMMIKLLLKEPRLLFIKLYK